MMKENNGCMCKFREEMGCLHSERGVLFSISLGEEQ